MGRAWLGAARDSQYDTRAVRAEVLDAREIWHAGAFQWHPCVIEDLGHPWRHVLHGLSWRIDPCPHPHATNPNTVEVGRPLALQMQEANLANFVWKLPEAPCFCVGSMHVHCYMCIP